MSNLGPVFEDDEHHSPGRGNAGKIIRDTAENILAISTTKQVGAAIPTNTAGGLVAGVLYVPVYNASFIRTGWQAVAAKHLHDADTDVAGGTLFDIRHANSGKLVEINLLNPIVANFTTSTVGSSTLTEDVSGTLRRLKFLTGGTSGNLISGRVGGISLSFASKCMFQWKGRNDNTVSLLLRTGINVDRVEDAQDTARRQFGMEACDGHGTNWVIINANGNTSSLIPTATTAALNVSEKNYKIVQIPASEVRLYENGVSVGVSNTNVASSGDTDSLRLFTMGVKTNAGSSRQIFFYHGQIIAAPGSTTELQ